MRENSLPPNVASYEYIQERLQNEPRRYSFFKLRLINYDGIVICDLKCVIEIFSTNSLWDFVLSCFN